MGVSSKDISKASLEISATLLKIIREENQLNQSDMAQALNISQSKLSKLEHKKLELSFSEFLLLVSSFNHELKSLKKLRKMLQNYID